MAPMVWPALVCASQVSKHGDRPGAAESPSDLNQSSHARLAVLASARPFTWSQDQAGNLTPTCTALLGIKRKQGRVLASQARLQGYAFLPIEDALESPHLRGQPAIDHNLKA